MTTLSVKALDGDGNAVQIAFEDVGSGVLRRGTFLLQSVEGSATIASLGTTVTTVLDINCAEHKRLAVHVFNTGGAGISVFTVEVAYNNAGTTWIQKYAVTADYSTNACRSSNNAHWLLIDSSTGLPSIASGANSWLEFNVERISRIRIRVATALSSTSVTGRYILKA